MGLKIVFDSPKVNKLVVTLHKMQENYNFMHI
jgi:hypothetical protein